jgi:PAS domain-containing protein
MSGLSKSKALLTGKERPWSDEEIIVTKTNLKGQITYANEVFQRVSLLHEKDVLGKPHNIIRHPFMPRCIFKLLWETVESKREIFAYVINRATNGDHYWVFAHVTPSFDMSGNLLGFHSNRRKPNPNQVQQIKALYEALNKEEDGRDSPKDGLEASYKLLTETLRKAGKTYDEYIFSI